MEFEYLAFAKIKSSVPIILASCLISSVYAKRIELKLNKIFSISAFSSIFKLFSSLFKSNTATGSINTVEPLWEISCTKPFIFDLYSCFTGITYLLFLSVTTFS